MAHSKILRHVAVFLAIAVFFPYCPGCKKSGKSGKKPKRGPAPKNKFASRQDIELTFNDGEKRYRRRVKLLDAGKEQENWLVQGKTEADFLRTFGFVRLKQKQCEFNNDPARWKRLFAPRNDREIEAYGAEMIRLARDNKLFPSTAKMSIAFADIPAPGRLRHREVNEGGADSVPYVHVDFGYNAEHYKQNIVAFGDKNVPLDTLHKQAEEWEADFQKASRFRVVNFWRTRSPMKKGLKHFPLAFCDKRSVEVEDVVLKTTGDGYREPDQRKDADGKVLLLKYRDEQKWYTYWDVRPDQVIVFLTFDTRPGVNHIRPYNVGRGVRTTFHSAFVDKAYKAGEDETRLSVEARVTVTMPSPSRHN